ncbi:MAG: hypothetical protein LBH75_07915 [Treponema sp.]|jgi:hypothetical protein|nr:hypothetical protein [Treponema sp.]
MRKLFSLIAAVGLTLSACGSTPYEEVELDNQSSYTVSFVLLFDSISETLEPGQTMSVDISGGFHGFKSLSITPKSWVEYKQEGNTVTFTDIEPITLEVLSLFGENVTLRTGGYMEIEPMTVKPSKDNHNRIYTKTPTFSVSYTYPSTVNFRYDAGRNTMYVTIH